MKGSVGWALCADGKTRSYYYRIDIGRTAGGARRQKTKRGFATEEAAWTACREAIRELERGGVIEPARESLARYLARWLDVTAHGRKPGTTFAYETALARLPDPLLALPLRHVTALTIQEAEQTLLTRCRPGTVRFTHDILKMALRQAVRWRMLAHNPAEGVDAPRARRSRLVTWTPDEARRFLAAAFALETVPEWRGPHYSPLWRTLLDAGLRIGEAQALRWEDVDLGGQRIVVRRTTTQDRVGRRVTGDPKSEAGHRVIPISHETARELEQHRRAQAARRDRLAASWQDLGLVFDRGSGEPFCRSTVQRRLDAAARRAGVPRLTPHGLRHTCATLLILAGVSPKIVSERLGHDDVAFTLDRYVHPDAEAGRAAADALSRLLGGSPDRW